MIISENLRVYETFARSDLGNISLRLEHTQLVDFDEAGSDHYEFLYAMVDGVGAFKHVSKLRNEKGADIVGLIIDSPSGCGLTTLARRTRSPLHTR